MEGDVRLQPNKKKGNQKTFRMLPPSPNWYLSNICAVSSSGIFAWGASKTVPLLDGANRKDFRFLGEILIHRSYVCAVCWGRFFNGQEYLVTVAEDRKICVMDVKVNFLLKIRFDRSCQVYSDRDHPIA